MTIILRPSPTIDVVGAVTGVSITDGAVTLDALAVPYGQATVDVPLTADTDLDDYDPRDDRRIIIHGNDGVATSRDFDLGLRQRSVDYNAKLVTLTLATDEALLTDYATLVEDPAPRKYEGSVRGVVGYVLAVAAGISTHRPSRHPT